MTTTTRTDWASLLVHRSDAELAQQRLAISQRAQQLHDRVDSLTAADETSIYELRAEQQAVEAEQAARAARQAPARSTRAYDQVHRVGAEARTYRPDVDRNGGQFIRDLIGATFGGDFGARERIERHQDEERVERPGYVNRAAGTGAFAGIVVPAYLTDLIAPAAKAGRPFADVCNRHPLPETGMTLNISRITTPTATGLQTTENTAVANQDIDDTVLSVVVQTAAGQQTLSRQAVDRGLGVEETVVSDLVRSVATTLDNTLLNQATTGLSAISAGNLVTYTDASPTMPELYPKIAQLCAAIEGGMLGLAHPTHAVMSPRRWYWLSKELTTAWPAFSQPGIPGQNLGVNNGAAYGSGVRGILPNGLLVVTDANIGTTFGGGTNEDEIYLVCAEECHLWEDPNAPVMIRAEQPAASSLGVLIVAWQYFGYTFARYPSAVGKIGGTGLSTPTW